MTRVRSNREVIAGSVQGHPTGSVLHLEAGENTLELQADGRLLWLEGQPHGEPVVAHGPFVMNTRAQIDAAIRDYETGHLLDPPRA